MPGERSEGLGEFGKGAGGTVPWCALPKAICQGHHIIMLSKSLGRFLLQAGKLQGHFHLRGIKSQVPGNFRRAEAL